jgi:trimeric autotransporter adhesin
MATTTNYSWTTPDDTDLVKDGASAIRTLGSSADTTVKDLNPGTTAGDIDYYTSTTAKARIGIGSAGQVLRVNSGGNAPEWATTADQTPLTTKGDLFGFDTADARIPIGTDGHILTADSTESLGLKWAAPAVGGANWSLLNAGGTSLTGAQTITVSGISAKDKIMVLIHIASSASASSQISFRINTDTGTNYYSASSFLIWGSTYVDNNMGINTSFSDSKFDAGKMSSDAASQVNSTMIITGGNTSGLKQVVVSGSASRVTGSGQTASPMYGGFYDSASTVSSVSVVSSSGNFDNGTIYVYASA